MQVSERNRLPHESNGKAKSRYNGRQLCASQNAFNMLEDLHLKAIRRSKELLTVKWVNPSKNYGARNTRTHTHTHDLALLICFFKLQSIVACRQRSWGSCFLE
eukprot:1140705-Pelagomonas_calceolata.AAC.1